MLHISEHFEYYVQDHLSVFSKLENWEVYYDLDISEDELYFDAHQQKQCIAVTLRKEEGSTKYQCNISSSYYIGLDRLPKLGCSVYVEPKLNNERTQINYIEMLLESLKEPENFDHLQDLVVAKFEDEWIEIENSLQPLLTPFLIAQFLSVVKELVKKGLKKSYYDKEENLNNRIKGKILVGKQIRQNLLKNRMTKTVCKFQDFGFDTEANRFLKFVLNQIGSQLEDFPSQHEIKDNLSQILRYCLGGFQQVSQKSFSHLKYRENNSFFKNYNQAIQLGNQILALKDYNISRNSNQSPCVHPPFWIDMSKLFELYVFKELRNKFPGKNEVVYHRKYNNQELDFIINTPEIKAVVDAKYKPRYKNGNPSMEDARQLAGYTRLNNVYKELEIDDDRLIPAYFIYPANSSLSSDTGKLTEVFEEENYSEFQERLLDTSFRKSTSYKKMFLQEIDLPLLENNERNAI